MFTLATGPVGSTPATQAALAQPVLHHTDPAFRALYAETVALLREAFGTSADPVIFPGEAVVGIEAAAAALIGPDDVVLNVVSGLYGRAFGQLAARFAREVIEVETAVQRLDRARRGQRRARPQRQRHDRGGGALRDAIGHDERRRRHRRDNRKRRAAADRRRRLELRRDADRLRALARHRDHRTAEGLGGSPGLSLLHVSDDAWRHIAANPNAPRGSALSIEGWRDAHRPDRPFPFTPSVTEIYGLRSSLSVPGRGPGERPRTASAGGPRGAGLRQALGLRLWAAEDAIRADTVTAIELPAGVDEAEVRAVARAESGVMLAGGQGALKRRVLQIGHMGPAAYP